MLNQVFKTNFAAIFVSAKIFWTSSTTINLFVFLYWLKKGSCSSSLLYLQQQFYCYLATVFCITSHSLNISPFFLIKLYLFDDLLMVYGILWLLPFILLNYSNKLCAQILAKQKKMVLFTVDCYGLINGWGNQKFLSCWPDNYLKMMKMICWQ